MGLQKAIQLGLIVLFSGHIHAAFSSQNVCKTYGSGVFETFNKTVFHLKSTCSVTLTHFTHAGVDCHIIVQRGQNGLMNKVEIIVNKIVTLIHNNTLTVEGSRISLPYDHTYQHVFHYGIYTMLRSTVLPLSVTWYNVSDGISSLWVQLDQDLAEGMNGLCGHNNSTETRQQLIFDNVLSDGQCLTQDSVMQTNTICRDVLSHAYDCLGTNYRKYLTLCYKNMQGSQHHQANCSFFKELSILCGSSSPLWSVWRTKSSCYQPQCPGDLHYMELGPAFPPTCTNPQPYTELTSTCQTPEGKVLNDRVDSYYSINVEDCPCVHGKTIYAPGQKRPTKCQTCTCVRGQWICSENICPSKCIIEGQLITTFDGKMFSLLDRCTYVAARGLNWTLNIQFSGQAVVIEKAYLNINQERYTFSANNVQLNNIDISDLSQTEHATVFWQSSMFIQVYTSFGMKMQVQVSPEIQIYLYLPPTETTKGLCGTFNNDTSDDFTTFSGITESSVQLFAQSWSMDSCAPFPGCINTDNEIFAEQSCDQLKDLNGVFAVCHDYVPVSSFVEACIQRTCQCSAALQECVCVSFGNYVKACATQGITVQEWRSATNCLPSCQGNLIFGYSTSACNHTCRSLSALDPTCEIVDDPVEGCGCTADTHLDNWHTCSPQPLCSCHHPGGITPPGPVVIGGRQCMCENGQLQCPEECDCPVDKVCVHCSQIPINTAQRTCESLTKPLSEEYSCISGCYCPEGLYEDHNGVCVTHDSCTCEFSGTVYETGQSVTTNCKTCTCRGGEWSCVDEACSGVCEVFGNGQYRTFDSKWYRFDGHCQYTLVKDAVSAGHGQFTIKTESVPCCDESLTCSRTITVELQNEVTLLLSDMKVTERPLTEGVQGLLAEPLYSIHSMGLYIIISVPSLGLSMTWDRHTRVTIQLESQWRGGVLGLCGNFDGKVTNDLLTSSSSEVFSVLDFGNSWKTTTPPCSDVTTEIFPCERHSYCAVWAQRRCMILRSDTFKDCHLKVDPEPYYQACVLESCSCEFEGKFLGFCTAVASYAEACSANDICINWRTPDLCPVYCDYYNEVDQYSWHYNSCGQVKTCGTNNHFTEKLEGCYPRCPTEAPYYDENTRKCSTLENCTCNFMNRVLSSQGEVCSPNMCCKCLEGNIFCTPTPVTTIYTTTAPSSTTINHTTTTQLPTTEITTKLHTTTKKHTTTTTQPEGTIATSKGPTKLYTMQIEYTTTAQTPTSERTTEYTTTTQQPTSESITEHTTTTTKKTTEYTTETSERTTELYTTPIEHTTTTQPPTSVKTTKSYTTMEHTTTTQPPSFESTTEYTTETSNKTTESYATPIKHTTTTQPPTSMRTIESYTTKEHTTTTQPPSFESTTEYTTETSNKTTESYATPIKHTTTTQPPTSMRTIESYTTKEHTTTTQPPSFESTTEYTTATSERTTELYTTPIEHTTTTQPPTSVKTTKSYTTVEHTTTTQPPSSESTTEYTTETSNRTTVLYTTPFEHTTTTQPPTSMRTIESYTTKEHTTTTQPTTEMTTTTTGWIIITGPATPSETTQRQEVNLTTMATSEMPSTTEYIPPECKDVIRNQSWPNGATWREDCTDKVCTAGVIMVKPISCPALEVRTDCPRDKKSLVKDKDTCCESWQCDCQCQLYGDPHYISFQGVTFDFLDNCTYTLVEEVVMRHHLSITVDNYFCEPDIDASCTKGITLKYWNDTATLMVVEDTEELMMKSTLNRQIIMPPYEDEVFKFESSRNEIFIYIKPIRSYVSLSLFKTLLINLATEHFINNTQGQCGVCGGPSCIRRNSVAEDDSCCDKTAYDWVVEDPLKSYCKSPTKNIPCHFPSPSPTQPPCSAPICDLLHHEVFSECSQYIDLVSVERNCRFDYCPSKSMVVACSSLEYVASECEMFGICVDWRFLTNGSCEVSCPKGMIYDECRQTPNDVCRGGIPVPATSLAGVRSGCFCPDGLMLAGDHNQICVSECPVCKGPLGEPMSVGAVWESNCHICTCNNQTKTEECSPKPPQSSPVCSNFSILVSDCCNNQICVEKTCEHNGETYKVGDRWTDREHPCESYSCRETGSVIERIVCPLQTCAEESRVWDEHHCCYSCNTTCAAKLTRMNVTVADCTQEVELPTCQGQCETQNRWVQFNNTLQLESHHQCCKESAYQMREITVACSTSPPTHFTYRHITGCQCKSEC